MITQVKGTGLVTTQEFVKAKFKARYDEWIQSLPPESQKIYSSMVMKAGWYPFREGYLIPMEQISNMFYNGDQQRCGDAIGQFSAEIVLTGIYKAFVVIASPNYLMKRASSMMSTFYAPSNVLVKESGVNQILMSIEGLPPSSKTFQYRIGGWCKRALEISKCKDVKYQISQSVSMGKQFTTIQFLWK